MISDKGIHRIAIFLSVLIHIILIIILKINLNKTKIQPAPPIVVDYKIKEIIVKKPSPIQKPKPKPKKPTSLPGDRKNAIVTKKITPFYPKDAINYSLEGTVKVKVTINKRGIVTTVKVLKSSGHKSLDNAFVNTIMNSYKFKPKRKMGKNKIDTLILEYTFKL